MSYFRTALADGSPTVTNEFFLMAGHVLKVGTERYYGSLDNASTAYNTYGNVSIGLKAGKFVEAGAVASLAFNYTPEVTPVDSSNLTTASQFVLSGETAIITVGMQEFKPTIFNLAFLSGTGYSFQDEYLLSFGGGCSTGKNRPVSVEFTNDQCDAPTAAAIANGITGGVVTLYDSYVSSGYNMDFNAKEMMSTDLEFTARPVTTLQTGNQLGSLWCY